MVATRSGFVGSDEVVELWFDAEVLPFERLLRGAKESNCAERVWTTTPAQLATAQRLLGSRASALAGDVRPDTAPKYYLQQTTWRHVPMTGLQAARVNALLAPGHSAQVEEVLSPRQLAMHAEVQRQPDRKWPELVSMELRSATDAFVAAARQKQ